MAKCSELSQLLLDMTTAIAESPTVHNVDNVVAEMKKTVPDINREMLVDAIVEATMGKKRNLDELKQKLAEIKREAKSDKNMRNTITALEEFIETGTFPDTVKEPSTAPQAIKMLRIVVKKLRAELSKTEAAKEHRRGRLEPKTINNLEQEIAILEKHIEEGTLPAKVGNKKVEPTDAVKVLREKREQLKKELAKTEPFVVRKLREQIELLEKRIETGDIFPKPKEQVESSREIEILEFRKDRLQRDIRARIKMAEPRGVWGNTKELFNAFRALMTGGEFSLVLRQGGWATMTRPGIVAKAIPKMFKSFASEEVSHKINEEILSRPNAHLYAKGKLHLAPIDGSATLSAMEELYMSHWIEKIPLIKNFQRAGLTFLNEIRADTFDVLVRTLPVTAAGAHNMVELKAIANYVNIMTGRGNLGAAEKAAETLNTIFFAPKYVASRFQLVLGQPLRLLKRGKATPATRKLIAKEYGRAIIGISTVLALGALAGGDLEEDPRSTDFLKLRFGKTRLDPLFGLSQTTVVMARILSGTTKRGSGEVVPISGFRGKVPFGGDTAWDVFGRFMRGKLSPLAATTTDLLVGENVIGEEVDLKSFPLKLITPLAYKDIYEALQEQGVEKGTAFSLLVFFGMGLQTYEAKKVGTILDPLRETHTKLISEISRLGSEGEAPAIAEIEKFSSKVKGLKQQLSPERFQAALKFFGREYGEQATKRIRDNDYRKATDAEKKEMLNKVRDQVRAEMLKKFKFRETKKKPRR